MAESLADCLPAVAQALQGEDCSAALADLLCCPEETIGCPERLQGEFHLTGCPQAELLPVDWQAQPRSSDCLEVVQQSARCSVQHLRWCYWS